jgi:hypothetical protein
VAIVTATLLHFQLLSATVTAVLFSQTQAHTQCVLCAVLHILLAAGRPDLA